MRFANIMQLNVKYYNVEKIEIKSREMFTCNFPTVRFFVLCLLLFHEFVVCNFCRRKEMLIVYK